MVGESPGRNASERRGGPESAKTRRPSLQPEGEGSMDRRSAADAAGHSGGGGGTGGRVTGAWGARGEAPPAPPRKRRSQVGRITGTTGKSAEGERVAEGPAVASRRGNARGAKGPCCPATPSPTREAGAR